MSLLPDLSKLSAACKPCNVNLERWDDRKTNAAVKDHRFHDNIIKAKRCSICFKRLSKKAGTAPHTYDVWALTELPNGNVYHTACLSKWLRDGNNRCPLTRNLISPKVITQILNVVGPPPPVPAPVHPWGVPNPQQSPPAPRRQRSPRSDNAGPPARRQQLPRTSPYLPSNLPRGYMPRNSLT